MARANPQFADYFSLPAITAGKWRRAIDEAIGNFDAEEVKRLAPKGVQHRQEAAQWAVLCRDLCRACHKHEGDRQAVPGILDALLAAAGDQVVDVLGLMRIDGMLLGHLLRLQHPDCDAWARQQALPLSQTTFNDWMETRMLRIDHIDLLQEAEWRVDRSTLDRFRGVLLALGFLRGEGAALLDELMEALELDANSAIGEGLALVLWRRQSDEQLVASMPAAPCDSGFSWLMRRCPPVVMRSGAQRAMPMLLGRQDVFIEPLIGQMIASVENQRLESHTPRVVETAKAEGARTGLRL